ncbi:MAG: universal stress protein [Pseudomonadales bacterium]
MVFNKVLVPVDLQDPTFCMNALKVALREVQERGSELHIITVLPGFNSNLVSSFFNERDHNEALKKVAQALMDFTGENLPEDIKPKLKVLEGSAPEEINKYVRNKGIDLVVLRAHQRSKINEFLLGSVSARVVERAYCSVFVIKD